MYFPNTVCMSVCVYEHHCICTCFVCAYRWVCVCAHVGVSGTDTGFQFQSFSSLFSLTETLMNRTLPSELDWQVSQPQRISCLPFPSPGIIHVACHTQILYGSRGPMLRSPSLHRSTPPTGPSLQQHRSKTLKKMLHKPFLDGFYCILKLRCCSLKVYKPWCDSPINYEKK